MLLTDAERRAFSEFIGGHLDAAYNLARWIVADERDAADVLQDACFKAVKGFADFRGGNARAWLLTIVRNTAYNYLRDRKQMDELPPEDELVSLNLYNDTPEVIFIREASAKQLREEIERLPAEYREAIVLREMEEMSYKEIAAVQRVPVGTVMSRLARDRSILRERLSDLKEAL